MSNLNGSRPRTISVELRMPVAGGGSVVATVYGAPGERDEMVYEATDAVLTTRARMSRVMSPFPQPLPVATGDTSQDALLAAYPCENPDPEGRVA